MVRAKVSFIHGGRGSGSVANRLLANDLDVGCLRPFISPKNKKSYICVNNGMDEEGNPKFKNIVTNAPATLRKDEWIRMDDAVLRVQRDELRVWADLVGAGLMYTVPDGMGVTVIQHQTMGDAGEATFSMSGLRKTKRDRPEFGLDGIPLPIVHSDFSFDLRSVRVARKLGLPLDTNMVEQCTRKCIEAVEDLTVGTMNSYSYAGYPIYGLTNHPSRMTQVLTLPTDAGWTPDVTYEEILAMIQKLDDQNFGGPYGVYFSRGWTQYLSKDYSAAYPGATLRTKLNDVDEIRFVRKATRLSNFQIVIVKLDRNVIEAIQGMPLTTLQWTEEGGMELLYKVLGIMVPRVRANAEADVGIVHGVAA